MAVVLSAVNTALQDATNNITFEYLEVFESLLPKGVDALLGMDIITQGYFCADTNNTTMLKFIY